MSKTKLTLSMDEKAIRQLKLKAKASGMSLSAYLEKTATPDERKQAWHRLKKSLDSRSKKSNITDSEIKKKRIEYLQAKHA